MRRKKMLAKFKTDKKKILKKVIFLVELFAQAFEFFLASANH
jgi:hypothetical protein